MTTALEKLSQTYTQVIGGGGFGEVKTDATGQYAIKFLYARQCPSAKKEYLANRSVYSAYKSFLVCMQVSNVSVVKPLDFVEEDCQVVSCGNDRYACAVIMERLTPWAGEYAMHLAFNGVVPETRINTLVLTNNGIPRGYFYDPTYFLTHYNVGLTLEDITYRIGLLDGITIFGARMNPVDAEYVLTNKNGIPTVTMLDFGMFTQINVTPDNVAFVADDISSAQMYNLYYHPGYSEVIPAEHVESCKQAFIKGISDAFQCFENKELQGLYDELIKLYNQPAY
jgi:hypothetical protein